MSHIRWPLLAVLLSILSIALWPGRTQAVPPVSVSMGASYDAITTGSFHTCALRTDGSVWCWGANGSGQLGDGTTTARSLPVRVLNIDNAIAISAGGVNTTAAHTCALLRDGTVRCWGDNIRGQLGNNSTTDSATPVTVQNLGHIVQVSAGFQHTCAVRGGGEVYCWGYNAEGQLGVGDINNRLTPAQLSVPDEVIQVSATGTSHSCAVTHAGSVYCWGANGSGQLGTGNFTPSLTPIAVAGVIGARGVSAGISHTCAVVITSGGIRCWGANGSGQLGNGTTAQSASPVSIALSNQTYIATGGLHSCAMSAGGNARCWGENGFGQIGNSSTTDQLTSVPAGSGDLRAIDGGSRHTCALIADGSLTCWGENASGQLGDGTTTSRLVETPVSGFEHGGRVQVGVGYLHTCAVNGESLVSCWGAGGSGQLGLGTVSSHTLPQSVPGLANVREISGGGAHTCARVGSSVQCWGANSNGQVGNNSTTNVLSPTSITNTSNAVAISSGLFHTCAIIVGGTVRCWGDNASGQLGLGDTTDRLVPTNVPGLANIVAISAGYSHTCALTISGATYCWGGNESGQIGDGTTVAKSSPVLIAGMTNAVTIGAGASHSCATSANGLPYCWGRNVEGQIGDSTNVQRLTPTLSNSVVNGSFITHVLTGFGHTCVQRADGILACWGYNEFGQLGVGTTSNSHTAAYAGGVMRPSFVSLNGYTSCAVTDFGVIRCWGYNFNGGLGNGTTDNALSPAPTGLDSDGDGCADSEEALGVSEVFGGGRDPFDPWDFFDVTGEKAIDLNDTLVVLAQFGLLPGSPGYNAKLDRYAPDASKPWRTAAANQETQGIDLTDALLNLQSFGHSCAGLP